MQVPVSPPNSVLTAIGDSAFCRRLKLLDLGRLANRSGPKPPSSQHQRLLRSSAKPSARGRSKAARVRRLASDSPPARWLDSSVPCLQCRNVMPGFRSDCDLPFSVNDIPTSCSLGSQVSCLRGHHERLRPSAARADDGDRLAAALPRSARGAGRCYLGQRDAEARPTNKWERRRPAAPDRPLP